MANTNQTKSQAAQQLVGTEEVFADLRAFDWLSLIDPINSLILGTGDDDVLSAQADGDIVLGLAGNDRLNSTFNLTALIGGDGEDTLTTNVIVPLQSDAPVHGIAIQLGETGNDDLDATVTLQGGIPLELGTGRCATRWRQWQRCYQRHSKCGSPFFGNCNRQHLRNRRRRQRYHQCYADGRGRFRKQYRHEHRRRRLRRRPRHSSCRNGILCAAV